MAVKRNAEIVTNFIRTIMAYVWRTGVTNTQLSVQNTLNETQKKTEVIEGKYIIWRKVEIL